MSPRRRKLAIIDPHHDLPLDLVKSIVVVAAMGVGVVLRMEDMPAKMAGVFFMFVSVLLLLIWGKGLDVRRDKREKALRARLGERPYAITGFIDYLVADAPVIEIRLEKPIAREEDAEVALTWLDDLRIKATIPPTPIGDGLVGGDDAKLIAFLDRWATPRAASIDEIALGQGDGFN
jgi:hypothetical protein